jgi:hypothetical protein
VAGERLRLIAAYTYIIAWVVLIIFLPHRSYGMDVGQWEGTDPEIKRWYQAIMQPDNPAVSCCGEADSYECDDFGTETDPNTNKQYNYCKITDDRPDEPRKRKHWDIGEKFIIPDNKMKWGPNDPQKVELNIPRIDRNPTGHNIVFLSRGGYVYCFVLSSGT